MPRLRDISIRTKLFLLMSFTAFLALALVATSLVIYEKTNAGKFYSRQLISMADIIALNSGAVLAFQDEGAAREILNSLSAISFLPFCMTKRAMFSADTAGPR
jgi:two-component system, sensor histidine kinase and response regulator